MPRHAASLSTPVALLQQLIWDDLRVFMVLARQGSMRLAAEQLGVNVSTVSRRLVSLETALGARLLERHPDGVKLTPAGRDVLEITSKMNEVVSSMAHRVAGADRGLEGRVRLTVPEVLGLAVAEVVSKVIEQHPGIHLDFSVDDRRVDLQRHEADIAVRVSDVPPADLVGRKLGRAGVGVYASKRYLESYPFELNDERHRWVEWPTYVRGKAAHTWLEQTVPLRRVSVLAGSAQAVCSAVTAGHGLGLLVHAQVRSSPELVSRWTLPDTCGTDIWALTHRETRRNARVRVVLDALNHLRA